MSLRRSQSKAAVPLSAIIDITFLLLMYFIVTAVPSRVEAQIAINLPTYGPPPPVPGPPPSVLEVHVKPNDQYLLMGQTPASLAQLRESMMAVASLDPTTTVLIKVDQEARQHSLVELLDLCAEARMTKLNVLTLK